ncbi:hypothetical protein MG293_019004 [Ovis ammon polii]|uniref:Uncharacterized protein n=1 Tax=Ovis ammon polii TaxID=230172 RepID=A0AAD4Y2N1_OVIAM|nr:hypothetical protein MG293_019004 [Ovis ammon polii]
MRSPASWLTAMRGAKAGLPDFDGCSRTPWPRIDANTCPPLRHYVEPRADSENSGIRTCFVRRVDIFRSSGFLQGKAGSCGCGRAPGLLRGSSFSGLLYGNGGGDDEWEDGPGKAPVAIPFRKRTMEGHVQFLELP